LSTLTGGLRFRDFNSFNGDLHTGTAIVCEALPRPRPCSYPFLGRDSFFNIIDVIYPFGQWARLRFFGPRDKDDGSEEDEKLTHGRADK
jgi:hypothetical protein